ncbi:hypothetical protein UAS_00565 [Enterococcus asini ATCC 700915]|uniref:Uncharacterized protein n=1 Tax=Enterococcus asini ATCC 700915 TaxID=1158606 RepID=R2S9F9_9ENTE|nr:hypothetical protein [Enterococcus asini]EOH89451.1 hypothetical protein UAS_00565 [Enterococcus asini ATCC 700915]EOT56530.1 hypothetical protein I579_00029 [Enterococcus asini ATCC 700915]
MNKKFNLFTLGVVAGLGFGFAPMVVKVLTLFSVVAILWNEWDEYEVRRGNDDLYKYSENVGTNARSKEY